MGRYREGNLTAQIITIRTHKNGERYWHSDAVGWVPHKVIDLNADSFPTKTVITVDETGKAKTKGAT